MSEASNGVTAPAPSASALGMRRHRERRRDGLSCSETRDLSLNLRRRSPQFTIFLEGA